MIDLLAESSSVPSIVDGWKLSIGAPAYLGRCFVAVLGVRLVLSLFKMFAMKLDGEHLRELKLEPEARRKEGNEWGGWWQCYWKAFVGFGQNKRGARIDDHGLGAVIGMCELAAYPILIFTNQIPIIGGWVAIKTAGHWKQWTESRKSFNRFLFANLLNIGVAFSWLLPFVQGRPAG